MNRLRALGVEQQVALLFLILFGLLILASLVAALFLGLYELCTKHAVRENAVLPVLFLSTVCGALVWGTLLLVQAVSPTALPAGLIVPSITWVQHLQLLLKQPCQRP